MLGLLEEDLKQAMGVDTEPVLGPYTVFGFPNEGWKEYRLDSGQEVLVSRHFNVTKDEKGDTYIYPRGDTTCEPSAICHTAGTILMLWSARKKWTTTS